MTLRSLLLAAGCLFSILLTSCGSTTRVGSGTAPMDIALDTGNDGMFYTGTLHIPRSFHSTTEFKAKVELTGWGSSPANPASKMAARELKQNYSQTATYEPLREGQSVLSLARGKIELRGEVSEDGHTLSGDWYYDGVAGGSFQVAPKGRIFLSNE